MKKYQYQIVRYAPDKVTNEFINVGIIVYEPNISFLQSKFIIKPTRICQFFTGVDGKYLISILRHFQKEIVKKAKDLNSLFVTKEHQTLDDITSNILPKDDSALYCTDVEYGLDVDLNYTLNYLFESFVDKHNLEYKPDFQDDAAVWRKVYKKYFDNLNITQNLHPYSIKTPHDSFTFDKAWKNGRWNCFQPISFSQKRNEAIKTKVYKWVGILTELEAAEEKIHLYFLSNKSLCDDSTDKFIQETLGRYRKNVKVDIIDTKEAQIFAESLQMQIQNHVVLD